MKSRAAVAFGPGQPLKIVEIDVAPPKKGEVLVKITHTGVCHTDAFTLSGDDPARASVSEARRRHGELEVVAALALRERPLVVAEDRAVLGVRKGSALDNERERLARFCGKLGERHGRDAHAGDLRRF